MQTQFGTFCSVEYQRSGPIEKRVAVKHLSFLGWTGHRSVT